MKSRSRSNRLRATSTRPREVGTTAYGSSLLNYLCRYVPTSESTSNPMRHDFSSSGIDSDDDDGDDSVARGAAVASSHDDESRLRASANADGTDRAADAPALGPTRVVACGEASGERHHSAS